ncbi:MAG: uroporphyrinogen-III C-methyltransferase [Solirubrobacterales bacterium]|nr:uroporphyrinogen-III C-methyltransferase [Solirubrobacterales bacterium]
MTVYLVGAGPGDPELMTKRSLDLIASADVIIHDRLIPDGALSGARGDAELVFVGKQGGGEQIPQSEIDQLLVRHGQSAETVVRLKGGDPFVFGRGGEEAEVLAGAGIAFEVVPGVTAGIAAPAYAGIPVTHRDSASSVAFLTGHEDPTKPESALDWEALAAFPGTLCVYMGVRQLEGITQRLIEGGRPSDQPAALIQRGTWPGQRTLVGTLGTIHSLAVAERFGAPAIALFGPVAALRERIAWLESRPLYGVSVAVTRARAQAGKLGGRLRALGATVIEAPVIRTEQIPGPAPDLERYDLVVLSSPNGVAGLFARLSAEGRDARAFANTKVGVVGGITEQALAHQGIRADYVPRRWAGEELATLLVDVPLERVLVAGAKHGRETVTDALRARGVEVDVLALYETVVEPLDSERLAAVNAADYVTFASASSARNLAAAGFEGVGPRLVSIGPATSEVVRELGWDVASEATEQHDLDGLIAALLDDVKRPRQS